VNYLDELAAAIRAEVDPALIPKRDTTCLLRMYLTTPPSDRGKSSTPRRRPRTIPTGKRCGESLRGPHVAREAEHS
jgi:hypothetical protein